MKKLRIIFAGGGTGGHLMPALAIADSIKERVQDKCIPEFRFIGTRRGMEYRIRDKIDYPLSLITIRGLSRSGFLRNLLFPILLIGATIKSMILMFKYSPHCVIGTGGYVMGPVLLAAVTLNKFTVIQEQNSYPGLTTRRLASKVNKVFLGFEAARRHLSDITNTFITGNPVKKKIGKISRNEARKHFGFKDDDKVILVLGGSQGATSINQNIIDNIRSLPEGYELIWQTGELNYKKIADNIDGRVKEKAIFAFTDQLELAYAAADLAVARAGALTMAELEAAGLPALLIPYPFAAENHQWKNAEVFAKNNAAIIVEDKLLKEYNLLAVAIEQFESNKLNEMKKAIDKMRQKREKPAVDIITDEILELIDFEGRFN